MLSAFIYVNSIITRGHFPTFYHKITFSANKREENTIGEELGIVCHSGLLVKEVGREFVMAACSFAFLGEFTLRTERQHDSLIASSSDLEVMPSSGLIPFLPHKLIYIYHKLAWLIQDLL